jgi:hypothetical protein
MRRLIILAAICMPGLAYSQISETFSDGDFSHSPAWRGDTSKFRVNEQLQLQTILSGKADTLFLSTGSTYRGNSTWEFSIQLNFDPSAANLIRVYLCSDQEKLYSSLNGVFVQVGESGNSDSYDLYKQTGNTLTRLIDGPAKTRLRSDTLRTRIRVSCDAGGLWTLYTSTDDSNVYTEEGQALYRHTYPVHYFGCYARYTPLRSDKFIIDDILIDVLDPDTLPPYPVKATAIDPIQVLLEFNELLDTSGLLNTHNYRIQPPGYTITRVDMPEPLADQVTLTPDPPLTMGTYTLFVRAISDTSGNIMHSEDSVLFSYALPQVINPGDVLINEVFPDPTPSAGLPSAEFIELYNKQYFTISLQGWKYSDGTSTYTFKNDSIRSGEYLILCAMADTAEYRLYGRVAGLSPWPSLNNASDSLSLRDAQGRIISQLVYSDRFYEDPLKKNGGYSLELSDPYSSCSAPYIWTASSAMTGGTPGTVNSMYNPYQDSIALTALQAIPVDPYTLRVSFNKKPWQESIAEPKRYRLNPGNRIPDSVYTSAYAPKELVLRFSHPMEQGMEYHLQMDSISDCTGRTIHSQYRELYFQTEQTDIQSRVIINEIFYDETPQVGLPLAEYVELYNASDDTVNLQGWKYADPGRSYTFGALILYPKDYLIVCARPDTTLFQGYGKTIGISPFPSLHNTNDTLRLFNKAERLIDEVQYHYKWQRETSKRNGGWSLERIDPNSDCWGAGNWDSSLDSSGGTPGRQNSIYQQHTDTIPLAIRQVIVTGDSLIEFRFSKNLNVYSAYTENFRLTDSAGFIHEAMELDTDSPYCRYTRLKFRPALPPGAYRFRHTLYDCAGQAFDLEQEISVGIFPVLKYSLYINELFPDPTPQVALPEKEFIELYNEADTTVYLLGMEIKDPGTTFRFHGDSIMGREYVILCATADSLEFSAYGRVISLVPFPSLNNSADIITIVDPYGRIIDGVAYTDAWYKDTQKKQGGYTLERISGYSGCLPSSNWTASTDTKGGTPGSRNSVADSIPAEADVMLIAQRIILPDKVLLEFNQEISPERNNNTAGYKVDHGIGQPLDVTWQEDKPRQLLLRFSSEFYPGVLYLLSLSQLIDCHDIPQPALHAGLFYPLALRPGDILINEVLFNPINDGVDFVEIYNNTSSPVDLHEVYLANTNDTNQVRTVRRVSETPYLFRSGELLVLSTDPDKVKNQYFTNRPHAFVRMAAFPAFNDDKGCVLILSRDSLRIDQLNYSKNMHFALIDKPEGISLERKSLIRPGNQASNWASASLQSGGATPGDHNSQRVHEPGFSAHSITIEPYTFSPDRDGKNDELAIHYQFDHSDLVMNIKIYNTSGSLVRKLVQSETTGTSGIYYWDGLTDQQQAAGPGIYIIYLETFGPDGKVKRYKRSCVLAEKF